MDIASARQWAVETLKDFKHPHIEADVLLCSVLDCDRVWLRTHTERSLRGEQESEFKKYIQERADRRPVAYILGYKDWGGMRLIVNESVLVPRDETETLCSYIGESLKMNVKGKKDGSIFVLDIGTGSGAIACYLARSVKFKREESEYVILGVDISKSALAVAHKNASDLELDIEFKESDLLSAIEPGSFFDVVVANLPYVPEEFVVEKDLSYEPGLALYSGSDGLNHYQRLYKQLNKKSIQFKELWIEFLPQQKDAIMEMFKGFEVEFLADVGGGVFFAKITAAS